MILIFAALIFINGAYYLLAGHDLHWETLCWSIFYCALAGGVLMEVRDIVNRWKE